MIDEELYQQANEELASERRDLGVWARACSLAPEDHDEARYLYSNLRVEELLAARRAESPPDGTPRGERPRKPLETAAPASEAAEEAAGAEEEDVADASTSETTLSDAVPSPPDPAPDRPDASASRHEEDIDDFDDIDDFERFERESARPAAVAALAADPDRGAVPGDRDGAEPVSVARDDSGLEGDDSLVLELERQARELPIEGSASSASVPLFAEAAPAPQVLDDEPTGPLEIDAGGRHEYVLYRRPGSREQAVKQGGSIAALLMTLPWLLYRGLFGTAIAYALFGVAVLAGLVITAPAWLDAGTAATVQTRVAAALFASLALFGMIVAPWWQANRWRRMKLERRGFARIARVRAASPKAALAALGRTSPGDARHVAA